MKRLLLIAVVAVVALLPVAGSPAQAQGSNTWQLFYFNNPDWQGNPVFTTTASTVYFNWGGNSPGPNVPAQNWTATMMSTTFFYAGLYRFTVLADDEVVLTVNNTVFLDSRGRGQSGKTLTVDVPMGQGNSNLVVNFRQFGGGSYLYVTWEIVKNPTPPPPPPPPGPGPTSCPVPNSASSVQTQFGNYTPCIQQNIHQSNCFQSDGQWNSPNMGSIQMEPQIVVWGNCTPDSWATMVMFACKDPQSAKCSKTGAGWFPG